MYNINSAELVDMGVFTRPAFEMLNKFYKVIVGASSAREGTIGTKLEFIDDAGTHVKRIIAQSENVAYYYIVTHPKRVAFYTYAMFNHLNITAKERSEITVAALLHDIEKTSWNNLLLYEKSYTDFTEEDKRRIYDHPTNSAALIRELTKDKKGKLPGASEEIFKIIEQHHENIDGTGYPHKLRNGQIALGAKIIRVADSYDAMTADRQYRKQPNMTPEEAIADLYANVSRYDPQMIKALEAVPVADRVGIAHIA
ncbi:MAG: HD domain-containing protein [Planctomycetes bacterium]|nr:HD domain-containing protein [Planctomycetota bacterium]